MSLEPNEVDPLEVNDTLPVTEGVPGNQSFLTTLASSICTPGTRLVD